MGTKLVEALSILGGISASLMESNQEETTWAPQGVCVEAATLVRTLRALALAEEKSSTTFKSCKGKSMKATAYGRHSMPGNIFAKKDPDNPTYPNRGPCRASGAGKLRMLQVNKPSREIVNRVKHDVDTNTPSMKAHGTGVGGVRLKTLKSGEKVRDVKHTPPYSSPGGSKGPAGNREVDPSPRANAKPASKKRAQQKHRASARGRRTATARSHASA